MSVDTASTADQPHCAASAIGKTVAIVQRRAVSPAASSHSPYHDVTGRAASASSPVVAGKSRLGGGMDEEAMWSSGPFDLPPSVVDQGP